jgi:predicted DNA-binding transcriptional regulator AlpA
MVMEIPDRLVREREAADIIGFSVSWLQKDRLKKTPLIPFVAIGHSKRYQMSALLAFIKQSAA